MDVKSFWTGPAKLFYGMEGTHLQCFVCVSWQSWSVKDPNLIRFWERNPPEKKLSLKKHQEDKAGRGITCEQGCHQINKKEVFIGNVTRLSPTFATMVVLSPINTHPGGLTHLSTGGKIKHAKNPCTKKCTWRRSKLCHMCWELPRKEMVQ